MSIEQLLKNDNIRITFGMHRWLVWDEMNCWTVYEKPPYAKVTTTLIITNSLELALAELAK